MAMAASLHLLSVAPQSLSFHRSSSASASPLFPPPSCLKPLPKLMFLSSSVEDYTHPTSRFIRKVMVSSDLDEGLEMGDEVERSFSPELKLYVGNLPFNVDSAALAELFARSGNVEMVEVIYDKLSGRSRGFGFVTMSTANEVEIAAQQFNGYELHGRVLRVNSGPAPLKREVSSFGGRSREGSSSGSTNRVYVGNLAWGVDNLALETLFSEQGKVQEARVVYDRESGRSKGFGFVTYSSPDEVNNAIESLNGIDVNGRSIRVSPAESRPRGQY